MDIETDDADSLNLLVLLALPCGSRLELVALAPKDYA